MIFRFENVSAAYGDKEILRGLNFEIPAGEIVGVLGPNGAGKTTLLQLMAGVLRPRAGRIALDDRALDAYSRNEIARRVSVLPQDTVIDFPFTALEIVLMGRSPYLKTFQWESAEDLSLAREAMALTNCLQFADQDIRLLSGGERERVLLARALAQGPKVLLLDEPTTHLDLRHWRATYRLLERLNQEQGLTIILVLHDLNFASLICRRILLLAEQTLQANGPPQEVLQAERIERIYGTPVSATLHPETGKPLFLPRLS
jgi:iron complex transport system ATP-binding protein